MGRDEVIQLMMLAGRLRGLSDVMFYACPEPLFHGRPISEVLEAEAQALLAMLPPDAPHAPTDVEWQDLGRP